MARKDIRQKETHRHACQVPPQLPNESTPPPDRFLPATQPASVEITFGQRPQQKAQDQLAHLGRLEQDLQSGSERSGSATGQNANAAMPHQGPVSRPSTNDDDTRHMGYGTTNAPRGHAHAGASHGRERRDRRDRPANGARPERPRQVTGQAAAASTATRPPYSFGRHLDPPYRSELEVSSGSSNSGGSDDDRRRLSSRGSSRHNRSR